MKNGKINKQIMCKSRKK